ncbi:MAG: hypothetical protein LLG00_14830 [Planctomycetaceae bacterium]|nr:hypothetical protein [Planctomycetaceae bacterium]
MARHKRLLPKPTKTPQRRGDPVSNDRSVALRTPARTLLLAAALALAVFLAYQPAWHGGCAYH